MTEDLKQFTKDDKFLMLAFDHRGSFKKFINPNNPDSVTAEQATLLKKKIISSLDGLFSGILVDIETGLPAYENRSVPFLLPLEASGYVEDGGDRITKIERKATEIKQLGAHGAKILLYFNPDVPSANQQLETALKVVEDCRSVGLPLFLEIRVYPENAVAPSLVERSVQAFQKAGVKPDVWKLEYPGNLESCKVITETVGDTPWILLTAGVSFDQFADQLRDAAASGVDGFLAGRAVWQEAAKLTGEAQEEFLRDELPKRFKLISHMMLE